MIEKIRHQPELLQRNIAYHCALQLKAVVWSVKNPHSFDKLAEMGVAMIRFPSVQKNADGLTKSERLRDRTVKAISRLAAIAGFALALGATDAFTTPASATAVDAPQARVLVLTLNGASDNIQMAQYHRSHMSHSSHSSHRSHYSSRY